MATDLKPIYRTIEQQYTDLFFGKYQAGQWGLEIGYEVVPDYYAVMRMQLVQWQLGMDCSNELCTQSRDQGLTVVTRCSGTASLHTNGPCCPDDNARFQPL